MEVAVRGTTVTIVECRPPWRADLGPEWSRFPIAQLRHDPTSTEWPLNWPDRACFPDSGLTLRTPAADIF